MPVIILFTANDIELIVTEGDTNDNTRKPFDLEDMIGKVLRIVDHQPLVH